jgi:hypothetical protein
MVDVVKHICGTTAFFELCGGAKTIRIKKVKKNGKSIPVTHHGG